MRIRDGGITVPTTPGLGVELDRDALAAAHELYLEHGLGAWDDAPPCANWSPDCGSTQTPQPGPLIEAVPASGSIALVGAVTVRARSFKLGTR